jgi:glutamine amidotransferase
VSGRVTVLDYGVGNLHSVVKALRHAGAEVMVTAEPRAVASAERLVLPGVGAFSDGMAGLRDRGLVEPLKTYVETGRPLLGICLGMQLLLTASEEFGAHAGLALIPGRVVEIPRKPGLKVPQIGWNRIAPRPGGSWRGTLFEKTAPDTMVYFVHSFTAVPEREEDRLADTNYGGWRVCAAVRRDNAIGCQFHPEKSGPAGLAMLHQFMAL